MSREILLEVLDSSHRSGLAGGKDGLVHGFASKRHSQRWAWGAAQKQNSPLHDHPCPDHRLLSLPLSAFQEELKTHSNKNFYAKVHSSTIHSSQDVEATRKPLERCRNKRGPCTLGSVTQPQKRTALSRKDEPQRLDDTEDHVPPDSFQPKAPRIKSRESESREAAGLEGLGRLLQGHGVSV